MTKKAIKKIVDSKEFTQENFDALCEYFLQEWKQGVPPNYDELFIYTIDYVKKGLKAENINIDLLKIEFDNFLNWYEANDYCTGNGVKKRPVKNWKLCANGWFSGKLWRFKSFINREQSSLVNTKYV